MAKRILIVEDSRTQRMLLAAFLGARPEWELQEAATGAEAVARAADARPDLVLLDLHLPDTTAAELLPRLPPGVPVLVISTATFEDECRRAVSLGAAGYLLKPLDEVKLRAEVERALGAGNA